MKRLWVDGAFRGFGLGRPLVEGAILWATGLGFKAMYLDMVPAAMPEANRLYAAMGFEGKNKCRSFDCVAHDETVSNFAQDDKVLVG